MAESCEGDCGREYKSAIARTRAAKPAAEEASPAAVGKLFSDTMYSGRLCSLGSVGSESSRDLRRARRAVRQAVRREFVSTGWGVPFSQSLVVVKCEEQDAVVRAQRSFCERVTDMEELVGRLSFVERLPQYLITWVS
jgi:hypothetical protein